MRRHLTVCGPPRRLARWWWSTAEVQVDTETAMPIWWPTDESPPGERYLLGVDEAGHARFAVAVSDEPATGTPKGLRELAGERGRSGGRLAVSRRRPGPVARHPHALPSLRKSDRGERRWSRAALP